MVETCFNCGEIIVNGKCSKCGYEFSLEDICPRRDNLKCIHTNKICLGRDYENCKVLREND
jgi:hypothetical protein